MRSSEALAGPICSSEDVTPDGDFYRKFPARSKYADQQGRLGRISYGEDPRWKYFQRGCPRWKF